MSKARSLYQDFRDTDVGESVSVEAFQNRDSGEDHIWENFVKWTAAKGRKPFSKKEEDDIRQDIRDELT